MKFTAFSFLIFASAANASMHGVRSLAGHGGVSEECNSETEELLMSNPNLSALFESLEEEVDESVACTTNGMMTECEVDFKGLASAEDLMEACSDASGDLITTTATIDCEVASGNMFTFKYTNIMDCVATACDTSKIKNEIDMVMMETEEMIEGATAGSCAYTVGPVDREVGGDGDSDSGTSVPVSLGFVNSVILPAIALSRVAAVM